MCECDHKRSCYCEAMTAYAHDCQRKGVFVDWLEGTDCAGEMDVRCRAVILRNAYRCRCGTAVAQDFSPRSLTFHDAGPDASDYVHSKVSIRD